MWLVEAHGPVKEVEAYPGEGLHARADPSYKERILAEMASYGNGLDKLCDVQQPRPRHNLLEDLQLVAACKWQGVGTGWRARAGLSAWRRER